MNSKDVSIGRVISPGVHQYVQQVYTKHLCTLAVPRQHLPNRPSVLLHVTTECSWKAWEQGYSCTMLQYQLVHRTWYAGMEVTLVTTWWQATQLASNSVAKQHTSCILTTCLFPQSPH